MALYQIFLDIPVWEALQKERMENIGAMKRAAIYVRVNTTNRARGGDGFEQNPEVQETPLREMVARRGWTVARVYSDRMSGAKENRPGLPLRHPERPPYRDRLPCQERAPAKT